MRKGYKMTKLGEIPVDWEVVKVDEVFDFIKTKSLSRAQLTYKDGRIYYIHYGDIHSTFKYPLLDTNEEQLPKVDPIVDLGSNIEYLREGDLIIADASEDLDGVGACIELNNVLDKNIIGGLHTIVCRDKKKITANGIKPYLFKCPPVLKSLRRIATGASVLGISKGNLSKIELLLPSIDEQQKIANILSTVDEKIDLIQAQIQDTQALKKGLMQRLLTKGIGHTAFKKSKLGEIPEDWEVKTLINLGSTDKPVIKAGPFGSSLRKEFYVAKGYKVYGQEQVIKNDPFYGDYYIDNNRFQTLKSCKVSEGDILLSLVGTLGKVLIIPKNAPKGLINPRLLRISINKAMYEPVFLAHYLKSTKTIKLLLKWSQGGTMGVLNASMLKKLPVPIPSILEQQKIAKILSTVDNKLDLLQEKKTNYQALKKGLMQQLLTGKIRVQVAQDARTSTNNLL